MGKKARVFDKFIFLFCICFMLFSAAFAVFVEAEHILMLSKSNNRIGAFLVSVSKGHLSLYISVGIFFVFSFFLLFWNNFEKKRKLWRDEEELLAILAGVPMILFVFDKKGKIVLSEGLGLRKFRLKAKQLVGENIYSPRLDKYSVLRDYYYKALRGEHITGCIQVINRSYDVKFSPLYRSEKAKNIIGVIAVGNDVTDIKRTEGILIKAKEEALSATRIKTEFLINMSHEMRTPLNIIIGFSDLLNKDVPLETHKDYVSAIKTSSDILLNLINNILDLSKIESGLIEIDSSTFNVREFFQSIHNIFKIKAEQKGINLSFNIAKDIPLFLKGDVFKIQQILINLINNAIKYTPAGGVYVSVDKIADESSGKIKINISILDTGIGIPDDMKEEIFNPFVQANRGATHTYEGSGLGLAISRKLAKLLGGMIKVESKPELGSKFDLCLDLGLIGEGPVGTKTQVIEKVLISSLVEEEDKGNKFFKLSSLKILLVEDNVMNHFLMKEIFKNTGHILKIANNGQEAIDMAENEDFDLILIDIQMPVVDGLTASRIITENKNRKGKITPPIAAITTSVLNSDSEKYKNAGISYYLSKPIDVNSFLAFIDKFEPMVETESKLNIGVLKTDKVISSFIDINSLLVKVNEDEFKALQMLRYFTGRIENLIKNLSHSLEQGELGIIILNSRALKNEAINVCCAAISSLAEEIETSAKAEDMKKVKKNFARLKRNCENFSARIKGYI